MLSVAQKGHTKLAFISSTFFKLTFSELDVSNLEVSKPKFSHRGFIDSVDGEAVPLAWGLLHAPTSIWNPDGPCDLG